MNEGFASTGISFNLSSFTHTENPKWASSGKRSSDELKMKKALRKGGYDELNLYLRPLDGYLGYCYFPGDFAQGSKDYWRDGCDVLQTTVPHGTAFPYDEGKTATHEVGHWFGLFHTFQGGCDEGDLVDDTPAQWTATGGCPTGKYSCTGDKYPGLDPVHNYMDYSDE
ncbi:Ulilysin [Dactylellina cionopaga]|nr:Ulilysin [Dactylellina cionopaga]